MPLSCGDGTYHHLFDPLSHSLVDPCVAPLIDPLLNEQMLRDLGVSPGSVSNERAKAVFGAVLRNGLPRTRALNRRSNDSRSYHVMVNGWVAGESNDRNESNESNGNLVPRKGRKEANEVCDEARISSGGRLCWSLFLEAMVGDTCCMTL